MGVAVCSLKWEAARTGSQRIVYDSDDYHLVRFPYEESEESYDPWGMHDPGKAYPDPESGLIVPSHDGWGTVSALVFWAPDSRPVEYRARFVRDPLGSSTGYDSTATTDSAPTGGNQFRTYMWQMFVRKDTPLGLKVTARASGDVPVPAALTLAEFKLAVQTDVHVPE
ncbi:hypothetical protein CWI85_18565 [Streptomyces albidoflavus]|nr:hypothetical protein CWI85_18565 [Streptomyces albidoflavus]